MKTSALAVVAAYMVSLACSSSTSGTTQPTPTDVSTFASDYCNLLAPCCADAGLSSNGSQCRELITVLGGAQGYNAAAGNACISALEQAQNSASFCSSAQSASPSACSNVFQASGTVPPGGQCTQDKDCAPASSGRVVCNDQFMFVDGGTTQVRTCQVQITTGMAGQTPCYGTKDGNVTEFGGLGSNGMAPSTVYVCDRQQGIYCNTQTQACTALSMNGQPCTSDFDCVTNDYCSAGVCAPQLPVGSPCTQGNQNQCVPMAYCDASTQKCTAQLAGGSACSIDAQCQSNACVNGACGPGNGNLGLSLLCGH